MRNDHQFLAYASGLHQIWGPDACFLSLALHSEKDSPGERRGYEICGYFTEVTRSFFSCCGRGIFEFSEMSKKSKSDSTKKTARRATSNVFAMFEQNQIAEFKEAFQLIDSNKDGLIDKNDLRATFDSLGRLVSETDLNDMIAEAPGPINFTMFLTIFGERISGTDQEEVIKRAFKAFEMDSAGKINEKKLRKALTTWGEKLKDSEVDEAFKEAPIDRDGLIDINSYVKIICGTALDEE